MKDTADTMTLDLIEPAKKRGRPASGQAMSAAARKAAQRNRCLGIPSSGDLSTAPMLALITWMQRAVSHGKPDLVAFYAAELARRARENASG